MPDTRTERAGRKILAISPDGPLISSERDAVDLIGSTFGEHPDLVLLPVSRLDPRFFTLSTKIAGEIVQKFVNYQLPLAIIGDITHHLESNPTLRDYVRETNRGRHIWFVPDLPTLDAQLARHHTG